MDVPKIGINKILYTTDLSESGRHAFVYAASMAHQYGAELTVFHVVKQEAEPHKSLSTFMSDELWESLKKQDLETALETLLDRRRDDTYIKKCIGDFCEDVKTAGPDNPYVEYSIAVELGHPVEKIIEFADKGGYDCVVMASHGHSSFKGAMLGNTVRRVLKRLKQPVLIVRVPDSTEE
jgi:nucleotide-binding universal stress UspA family protein